MGVQVKGVRSGHHSNRITNNEHLKRSNSNSSTAWRRCLTSMLRVGECQLLQGAVFACLAELLRQDTASSHSPSRPGFRTLALNVNK